MEDITIDNPPYFTPPAVTRSMQAELLKHIAHNWPEWPTGWPEMPTVWSADMVRAALSAGAAMLDGTAPKRKPYDILAEDFGLKMHRFAADKHIRVIGVRKSGANASCHIVDTRVDRKTKQACVLIDEDPVLTIYGETGISPSLLEKIAVRSVLALMVEKNRCTRAERRRRAKARKEVQS